MPQRSREVVPAKTEGVSLAERERVVEEAAKVVVEQATTDNEDLPVGGRLKWFKDQWAFDPWAHSVVSQGLGWKLVQ